MIEDGDEDEDEYEDGGCFDERGFSERGFSEG